MDYRLLLADLKIINLQFLLTVDNDVSCHVIWGDFQKWPQSKKILFDLSIVDIQRESKGYSTSQIVQNNDLPTVFVLGDNESMVYYF